jgi:hypothetical protein
MEMQTFGIHLESRIETEHLGHECIGVLLARIVRNWVVGRRLALVSDKVGYQFPDWWKIAISKNLHL